MGRGGGEKVRWRSKSGDNWVSNVGNGGVACGL